MHSCGSADRNEEQNLTQSGFPSARSKKLQQAFEKCRLLALRHYENFPVGSILLPRKQRQWIHAIYAFARTADDFADENIYDLSANERLHMLDCWELELEQALAGNTTNDVFLALAEAIHQAQLDVQLLRDLLSAFRQDVVKNRYWNLAELLDYCRRSANPVGRLVLQIFNYRDNERVVLSDFICTALQLTNFWQDLSVDIRKDRIYLPEEEMQLYGITVDSLKAFQFTPGLRELIKLQCTRAQEMFDKGRPLMNMLNKGLKFEIKLTLQGGMEILRLIAKQNYNTLINRPRITKTRAAFLLLKALV